MQKLAINLFIACLLLSSCSNSSDMGAVIVDLYIKDHKFTPSVIEVPEGKKIILIVHNQDSTIEEFESVELKREKIVLGNSESKIKFAPLQVGEYKFFGDFHQDTAHGKIIVKKAN